MFSDLVVGYLFLGGTGAGMSLVLSLLGLLVPRESIPGARKVQGGIAAWYRMLFVPGHAVSLVLLVLGAVCLLADVGTVDRALLLFVQPNLSFIAVGAWALAACSILTMALTLMWQSRLTWGGGWLTRMVQGGTVVAALVAAAYTGLLLQSMPSVPLWASWWLPVLFVLSAASCGIAGVLGVAQFTGSSHRFAQVLRRLAVADAVVVVLEAAAAAFFVALAATAALPGSERTATDAAASASAATLLSGELAWLFWGGFVLLGLIVPLVLDVLLARSSRLLPGALLAAVASVLAGGFIVRFCIVQAGMHPLLAFGG